MPGHALAIDLGGTKTSWALVDNTYRLTDRREIPTPKSSDEIIALLRQIIRETKSAVENVRGVGIGVAGLVDFADGTIVAAPNLPLDGVRLTDELGSPEIDCFIDNDANLAVLGELYTGAGQGHTLFIGLTIGTGVGGGIVADGELWRGSRGGAAEFGHMVVDGGGVPCPCGSRGCLEQMASGTALERFGREYVAAHPRSDLAALFAGNPANVSGLAIAEAARNGQEEAISLFNELGRWLGIGIGSLINIFNPELVVLGGGVASSLDLAMKTVRDQVRQVAVDPRAKETPLILSTLENTAGLIGAAGLVLDR